MCSKTGETRAYPEARVSFPVTGDIELDCIVALRAVLDLQCGDDRAFRRRMANALMIMEPPREAGNQEGLNGTK